MHSTFSTRKIFDRAIKLRGRCFCTWLAIVSVVTGCIDPVEPTKSQYHQEPSYVIDPGGPFDLGTLGGGQGQAHAVNSAGTIVGFSSYQVGGDPTPMIWTAASGMQRLFGPSDTTWGYAFDINDNGVVVGQLRGQIDHAFRWANDSLQILTDLSGYGQSIAVAVNNNGVVAGNSHDTTSSSIGLVPFMWDASGNPTRLFPPTHIRGYAFDINDLGTIVGTTYDPIAGDVAFKKNGSQVDYLYLPSGLSQGSAPVATVVDESGVVYGFAGGVVNGVLGSWALRWDSAGPATFLDTTYHYAIPTGVNAGGIVVGHDGSTGLFGDPASTAWAWDPAIGTITHLGNGAAYDVSDDSVAVGSYMSPSFAQTVRTWPLGGTSPPATLTLSLDSAGSAGLHPAIRPISVAGVQYPRIDGGETTITISVTEGTDTLSGYPLIVRGVFLPLTNELSFLPESLPLENADTLPHAASEPNPGMPVPGHFLLNGSTRDSVVIPAADSVTTLRFVAGYYGGSVELTVQSEINGSPLMLLDTIQMAVPGLVDGNNLQNVYFTGWDATNYLFGSNWHVTLDFRDALQSFADRVSVDSLSRYVQYNDASLPLGGLFRVETNPVRDPWTAGLGHFTHNRGIDLDLALCYASVEGVEQNQAHRVSPSQVNGVWVCPAGTAVDPNDVDLAAAADSMDVVTEGNHYHLRYTGN